MTSTVKTNYMTLLTNIEKNMLHNLTDFSEVMNFEEIKVGEEG